MSTPAVNRRAIGGFLPLESLSPNISENVLSLWDVEETNAWFFANARSALAHLLQQFEIKRLFLPEFICRELVSAAGEEREVLFYPLINRLSPDTDVLSRSLREGDCVLAVDYFGCQPEQMFRSFVAQTHEVLWVEDRAQALMPAAEPWANWVLYSPRKLFGVPDGGIMVHSGGHLKPVAHPEHTSKNRERPRVMRRDDAEERDNRRWYDAYRQVEAEMTVSDEPISDITRRLLAGIDAASASRRRCENYTFLAGKLQEFALFPDLEPEFVPMGFPVRIRNRDAVWERLRANRIFPARYWPDLPSERSMFPAAHALSRELLLLPCDQRYNGDDMAFVATAFMDALE